MNWDAIGALGEIIGAVAVVASVAYLAIQIRGQTAQSKLAATREINANRDSLLDLLIGDREVLSLYLRAIRDYENMPQEDRIRASFMLQRTLRTLEQQYLHIEKGHMDPAFFDSMERTYFEAFTFPGFHQWWEGSKHFFEPNFRRRIDEKVAEAKKVPVDLPPLET